MKIIFTAFASLRYTSIARIFVGDPRPAGRQLVSLPSPGRRRYIAALPIHWSLAPQPPSSFCFPNPCALPLFHRSRRPWLASPTSSTSTCPTPPRRSSPSTYGTAALLSLRVTLLFSSPRIELAGCSFRGVSAYGNRVLPLCREAKTDLLRGFNGVFGASLP
jgi:hypothetical protein